jgi:hypothetical protein
VPNKTVDVQGNKSVIVRTSGSDKRHVTVILTIAANGAVLPTMIVFKGKRALKDIKAPKGCFVTVQQKAWVDKDIMIRWVDECLRAYTNRNRMLLVMDSFRGRPTQNWGLFQVSLISYSTFKYFSCF